MSFCFPLHHRGAALQTSCFLLICLWCCTAVPGLMLFCFLLHNRGAALLTSCLLLKFLVPHCCPCYVVLFSAAPFFCSLIYNFAASLLYSVFLLHRCAAVVLLCWCGAAVVCQCRCMITSCKELGVEGPPAGLWLGPIMWNMILQIPGPQQPNGLATIRVGYMHCQQFYFIGPNVLIKTLRFLNPYMVCHLLPSFHIVT